MLIKGKTHTHKHTEELARQLETPLNSNRKQYATHTEQTEHTHTHAAEITQNNTAANNSAVLVDKILWLTEQQNRQT